MDAYQQLLAQLRTYPQLSTLVGVTVLILVAWVANWIVKRILVRGIYKLLRTTAINKQSSIADSPFIARLANIVPAVILSIGVNLVPGLPDFIITVVQNVSSAFIVLTIALAISNLLTVVNSAYEKTSRCALKTD